MWSILIIIISMLLISSSPICGLLYEISFLVLSQKNKYHLGVAEQLKHGIIEQSLNLDDGTRPNIYLSHEVFQKSSNSWAIKPILIDILNQLIKPKTKWFVLCDTNSVVNLRKLLEALDGEDEIKETYLGYSLHDREPTIIHHFAFFRNPSEFHYHYLRAGVAFSIPLLNRLADRLLPSSPNKSVKSLTDFTIDAAHELALFMWNVDKKLTLKSVPYFCSRFGSDCAIYAREENVFCGNAISLDKVLFAVKTCGKYHKERLPVILRTWARFTIHLRLFSDTHDDAFATIPTGVVNTDHGHCEKSLKILSLVLDEIAKNSTLKGIEWVILADDDTLLSPSSLTEYLGCFDKSDYIYLGERYGYDLSSFDNGYNYITGGGGIVFNLKTVRKLVNSCTCPTASSPDDMIFGICLKSLNIDATHSSLFHQARSKDYPPETLDRNSISFHKFWQIDPLVVYERWFRKRDEEYYEINKHLLSDYKYLSSECKTPPVAATCAVPNANKVADNSKNKQHLKSQSNLNSKEGLKRRNNVKHVEL